MPQAASHPAPNPASNLAANLASNRQRRERLLALLPRVYAAQPKGSAVAALVDVMAQSLANFDADLRRVLHDRWVALACGVPDGAQGDGDAALDRLGVLLQIERLPPAIRHLGYQTEHDGRLSVAFASAHDRDDALQLIAAPMPQSGFPVAADLRIPGLTVQRGGQDDGLRLSFGRATGLAPDTVSPLQALLALLLPEPTDAYRQRLRISVAVTNRGLTTPRTLLSIAIADLGAEPCPKFRRENDATIARAVALGTHKRCKACGDASQTCPNPPLFDSWLTEQPAQLRSANESAIALGQLLDIRNDSLFSDRPELRLSVNRAVSFPALQSRTSGEIMLYADDLEPGKTLRILPQIDPQEAQALRSHDRPISHDWLANHPQGRAELIDNASGQVKDVSRSMYYLWGDRFDGPQSVFGDASGTVQGLRCGVLEQAVRTPRLSPGQNQGQLLNFASPTYRFDRPTSRLAAQVGDDGAHFSLLDPDVGSGNSAATTKLFTAIERSKAEGGSRDELLRFALNVDWVTKPPFLFHLRIPKNGHVLAAQMRGAVALLQADIDRLRAVGVQARIDFPEPVFLEHQAIGDAPVLAGLSLPATEDARPQISGSLALGIGLAERHLIGEIPDKINRREFKLSMSAAWDTTRFDSSWLR